MRLNYLKNESVTNEMSVSISIKCKDVINEIYQVEVDK
jgi:hypothetical protein